MRQMASSLFFLFLTVFAGQANEWDALNRPGAIAIMRHALAPGTGDPPYFRLGDCSTQRNLDARGRAQASAIGAALQERGVAFDAVLTSQWCRARETAELLDLGPVAEAEALNSFFRNRARRAAQTRATLDLLSQRNDRLLLVSHQVNISALTGRAARSGEIIVFRIKDGDVEVLGSIFVRP